MKIKILTLMTLLSTLMGCSSKSENKIEKDSFITPEGVAVDFYCIKHGSVRLSVGEKWVYVDPVISGAEPETDYTLLPKADYILITHDHYDHLDAKAVEDLSKEGTVVIANASSVEQLGFGRSMANGDSLTLVDGLSVEAVPAYNYSEEKLKFHPKGGNNGYILSIGSFRVYFAGDTEDIPEMDDIKDIDVAFIPCNLPYTMTPEQAASAARKVNPKVLFPYHYGNTEINRVSELLSDTPIEVRIRQYQ